MRSTNRRCRTTSVWQKCETTGSFIVETKCVMNSRWYFFTNCFLFPSMKTWKIVDSVNSAKRNTVNFFFFFCSYQLLRPYWQTKSTPYFPIVCINTPFSTRLTSSQYYSSVFYLLRNHIVKSNVSSLRQSNRVVYVFLLHSLTTLVEFLYVLVISNFPLPVIDSGI